MSRSETTPRNYRHAPKPKLANAMIGLGINPSCILRFNTLLLAVVLAGCTGDHDAELARVSDDARDAVISEPAEAAYQKNLDCLSQALQMERQGQLKRLN